MKQKNKLMLFYIFTFGIGYLIAKQKVNKIKNIENNLSTESIISNNDLKKLINSLGGINNIETVESTLNNIKVTLKQVNNVNQIEIKKLGATGSFISQNKITILFGDKSLSMSKKLQEEITKK